MEDYALVSYTKKIEEIDRERIIPSIANVIEKSTEMYNQLEKQPGAEMGWAMKQARSRTTFADDVIKFLDEKFEEGIKTGKKIDPKEVEKLMQSEKFNGKKRFLVKDRLTARQIASYFGRKAAKIRKSSQQVGLDSAIRESQVVTVRTLCLYC